MLAEESHGVVLGKLTDVNVLQTVFRYIGKEMFQERTLVTERTEKYCDASMMTSSIVRFKYRFLSIRFMQFRNQTPKLHIIF